MTSSPNEPAPREHSAIAALRTRILGTVYERGDAGLAAEAAAWDPLIVHDPELLVSVASEEDVVAVVQFAAAEHLHVRVQLTGHGADHPITDGVLIVTKALDSLSIDPETGVASFGAGVVAGRVVEEAAPLGLLPIVGSASTVGMVGLLLGAGIGPLVSSHGFGSDWVRSLRVVTASGNVVVASPTSHTDLFWALRGGKRGLGIVTQADVELAPIATMYAGGLMFEGDNIATAFRAWVDWTSERPKDVTSSIAFLQFPDLEVIPPPMRGRFLLHVRFAFPGDAETGAEYAAPLRAAAPVYLDALAEIPNAAVASIHNDPTEGSPAWISSVSIGAVDQEFAGQLLDHVGPDTGSPFLSVELRDISGASEIDVAGGSAAGGRTSPFILTVVGLDPRTFPVVAPASADALLTSVGAWISAEPPVNFDGLHTTLRDLPSSWSQEVFERLVATRHTYDPTGMFAA